MTVIVKCKICGDGIKVEVSDEGFRKWQAGMSIQRAMLEVSADDREALVSGVCGPCFDKLFEE